MGVQAHQATRSAKPGEVEAKWFVVDATDQILGRMSTQIASILRGKHHPLYTPHVDTGDHVIVINAEKVKLTGRKREQKLYYRHSGYTGSLKQRSAGQILEGPHPDRVVRHSIRGMLPKNTLGRHMLRKLKDYAGPEHPHAAPKPEELKIG